ncbi:MAG: membrane protein insertion efficiency factor YidD [Pseudonocardia sp.]|nr:membrane protein insertion efficiency factor YidD [Pseudonocardia sp.]
MILTRALIVLIRGYQRWVSPALPPSCRFYPTCSAYAVESLQVHGILRGTWLTLRRLLRCGPWHPGGIDRVPPARHTRTRPARDHQVQDHHEEQAPC